MKKVLQTITLFALLAFLAGCEGKITEGKSVITIQLDEEYEIRSGDVLTMSEGAEYEVRHVLSTDRKYVTLISGDASLLRGDYVR